MIEEEICEHILKWLPKETFQLVKLADNTSIASIKKTLEKQITNLLWSGGKVNEEVERLTREMEVLKNCISQINIGLQIQNNIHNGWIIKMEGKLTITMVYNRNQPYQPLIFNNPNQYYQSNPRPSFFPYYNYTTNNNQMTNTQFPRPNFYQNVNYNTNNNQLANNQVSTQINQGTIPPNNYNYRNQQDSRICFQCGIPGHINR